MYICVEKGSPEGRNSLKGMKLKTSEHFQRGSLSSVPRAQNPGGWFDSAGRVYGPNCNKSAPYAAKIMIFSKTRIAGNETNVIFTGAQYFFITQFYGIVAVAERVEELKNGKTAFEVKTGNKYCEGGSLTDNVVFAAAKKFILKSENEYIPVAVDFSESRAPLHAWTMSCTASGPAM